MYYMLLIRDGIEIFFFSLIIYSFCLWLKTDRTKNLLPYFLFYCTLTLFSWAIELQTLTSFLFSYAPVALLLFITLHEKTLQKNFVALKTITPTQPQHDWIDTLLSSALATINNNKNITIIIEHKDSLEHFVTTPFFINADMSKNILSILLSSTSYDEKKSVWINAQGQIKGINTDWISPQAGIQDALFYSLRCDALIIHGNNVSRAFTFIAHGQEKKHVAVHEIKNIIKKELFAPSFKTEGMFHAHTSREKTLAK